MFYSVVMLDGKELHCLSLAEVQDLFFKRQINSESLVCNAEDGQWQMLKRSFDLTQWIPTAAPPLVENNYQPSVNPFQTPPANQPFTFNQFPPNEPSNNNPYAANGSNGYSQNNQSETYYQADTKQSNYQFQNKPANYAPSNYASPANSYNYAAAGSSSKSGSGKRQGLAQSAVFLALNLFFYVLFVIVGSIFKATDGGGAYQVGQAFGGLMIPLIIDLAIVSKLWKVEDEESARKWGLARAYYSLIAFGILVPLACFSSQQIAAGLFSMVSAFLLYLSLSFVLHGKQSPPTARLVAGGAVFALYGLLVFGTLGLAFIGKYAPEIAKLDSLKNSQLDKFRVEGKEFQDKTTGAKVVLPEGWTMISLDNPLIHTPEARMIAIDKPGNRLTMLEVVPVPGNLDMKRQNSTWILDQISDSVVQSLKAQVKKSSGFGQNYFNEITRLNIYVGTHPAKLLVFDKTENGVKAKGHLIITYDELTFYVLHSWCPAEEYETAQNDFKFFEQNFTVPEKINSTFTQTAETQKK